MCFTRELDFGFDAFAVSSSFFFFKYSVFGFNLLIRIAISDLGYLLSVSVQLTWCAIF